MTIPEILVLIASASSEYSVESAHMHRLDRAFAVRINEVWMQMKGQTKILDL